MKIKFRNWLKDDGNGRQLLILPIFMFYWNNDACCLIAGWLGFVVEAWFGNVGELI